MSGTKEGAERARDTNKKLYGNDFYRIIGRKGGLISRGGPFSDKEFAREMGRKGGKAPRRKV